MDKTVQTINFAIIEVLSFKASRQCIIKQSHLIASCQVLFLFLTKRVFQIPAQFVQHFIRGMCEQTIYFG